LSKVACKGLPYTMIFFPITATQIKPGTSALVIKTNNRRTFYEITKQKTLYRGKKLGEKALSKKSKRANFTDRQQACFTTASSGVQKWRVAVSFLLTFLCDVPSVRLEQASFISN